MAAGWDLAFPLVIACLVFIRGHAPLPTTSEEPNPDRPPAPTSEADLDRPPAPTSEADLDRPPPKVPGFSPDDYKDDGEEPNSPATERRGLVPDAAPCAYDRCLQGETPCAELLARTGCLCPGFTLNDVVPEAAALKAVTSAGSEVVARWCAPYSYVTAFVVTVTGKERRRFEADRRSGAVGHVDDMAEVCVAAVNDAGAGEGSCVTYRAPGAGGRPLTAGLVGGALGLLLLAALAAQLCRRRRKKREAGVSGTAGGE